MGGYAWVTLATNDSYSLGALVLARSLEQVGTRQQLAVLVTPGVTKAMRSKLTEVFNVVQEVNLLDSRDEENLRLLKRPELGVTFTKLHCWRLTQFDKCVFLDADTLVLENCDELFDREELSAAPDVGWPDCFNSGVFVFRPSNETYKKIIRFAMEKGSFDGGDQGLLNLYFSDWSHKDISKHLPFIYNMSSTACYSYLPAFKQFGKTAKIIHFIGFTKPWLQYFDSETKKVHPSEDLKHLQEILQHWWDLFCAIHSSLSPEMTSHTDTVHGSQSRTYQATHQLPHHHHNQTVPSSNVSHPAEDYQNVWDPWEEYDSRESQDQHSVQSSIPDQTFHVSYSTYTEPACQTSSQVHVQSHTNQNQRVSYPLHSFETHSYHFQNQNQSLDSHKVHCHSHSSESHNPFSDSRQFPESHNQFSESHNQLDRSHNQFSESLNNQSRENRDYSADGRNLQNQLFEPHNTNANSADHHNHPPSPTCSHPQTHILHYEDPSAFQEKSQSTNPPPPDDPVPRLPDECVTTTTVSNEIILQTGSHEETNKNAAGLAGAFAKLTLGTPRTPEQAALDDHLRRQGWEVGNIDYLGRDSFKNIWSKICETLSAASEQPVLKTEYHKVEDKPKEISPTEVDSVEKAILESKDKQVTPLSKSQIEVEIESSKQVGIQDKVEATSQTAFISLETETLTKSPSSINADQASFPTSSESQISATIPSESLSVSPTPAIHVPENPTSVSAVPSTQPAESPTSETLPVIIPAPLTPSTDSTVTESPAPQTTEMEYPVIPKSPVLEAPTSSTPASSVTDTPATVTSNHVFPTPVSTLYETPATVIVAPTTPAPITVGSETSGDIILAPTIPTPAVPVKIPVTLSPETSTLPAFIQTCPENLATATLVSKTPVPESPTPAVPDITPIGSMPEAPQPTEEATVTKEETFETVSVLSKDPPKIGKISRDTAEKSREIQTSKTHVTKTTSPSTTVSAQTEETKPVSAVATDVLDTPPVPAPESSFAPKPTPRKSNRSDKKSGTKTKK
nr:flocculation protein FLO11-like isoform X1 [Leptinotarsa decemlineata]